MPPETYQRNCGRMRATWTAIFAATVALSGCELSQEKGLYERGDKLQKEKKYDDSLLAFEKLVKGYPDSPYAIKAVEQAANEALELKKDPVVAARFLKEELQISKKPEDTKHALALLAEVQFEKIANYTDAIVTYNQLLDLPHTPAEGFTYKMNLARANYFTNKFSQALAELNDAAPLANSADEKFQMRLLRANVFLAQKQQSAAIEVLTQLLNDFPDQSRKENVGLTLAVSMEEKGDLGGAIEVLTRIRSTYPVPEFIERKIARLTERKMMQPGARGHKK